MNDVAMWLGYGVMVIGGVLLVLFGFVVTWRGVCGAACGFLRATRAIRSALHTERLKKHRESVQ